MNVGDEVKYNGVEYLVVNIFEDGEVILVPLDIINTNYISVVDDDIINKLNN